jgi:periplasmic protein TonB
MDTNKIMTADILDIIFEGRNKLYGAYELRKTYNRRVAISLVVMATLSLSLFFSSIFANDTDKDKKKIFVDDVNLKHFEKEKPNLPPPPPPPPPPAREVPRVQVTQFTPFDIVRDEEVIAPPPAMDELDNTRIGLKNQPGVRDDGMAPPVEEKGSGIIEAPKAKIDELEPRFTKIEKEAKFPGGPEAWRRYLERNLNANVAAEDGAPTGNYTVKVQFIVDKNGSISNVQAIEVPKVCPTCGEEAVKIIKKGGAWEPAIQNGRPVTYQAIQFVTFKVAEE